MPLVGAVAPLPPEGVGDPPLPPFFAGWPLGVTAMMPMLPATRVPRKVAKPPVLGTWSLALPCTQ